MFAIRYFPSRYFASRYWTNVGATAAATSTPRPTYFLEYRTDQQVIFWTVNEATFWSSDASTFWSAMGAWVKWVGSITSLVRQQYEFRLTVAPGLSVGVVSALTLNIDMPDVTENILNVAIGSGGTRLSLTKTYQSIKVVSPKLLEDGGTATHIKISDKDIAGPLLNAYDKDGIATTAHADVTVQGY